MNFLIANEFINSLKLKYFKKRYGAYLIAVSLVSLSFLVWAFDNKLPTQAANNARFFIYLLFLGTLITLHSPGDDN